MTRLFALLILGPLLFSLLSACGPLDIMGLRNLQDGVTQTTPLNDGVTQTTPLISGEVLTAAGEPAVDVRVRAYVSGYRVAAAGETASSAETRTDASGRFRLVDPPTGMNTVEAEASEDSKAIRMKVAVAMGARLNLGTMQLQPTGSVSGRVKAAGSSDLLGTTIFIPGTQYAAFASANGNYLISRVPLGTYELAAMRPTFATALIEGVTVLPQQTVQAPDLVLSLDAPVLETLSQSSGGAGTVLTLKGRNFGASKNTVLAVTFGSTHATTFERVSDTEIRVNVPEKSTSGPVVVRSNGVASNGLDFAVIASLKVKPYYAGLYVGDRQQFEVEARDAFGTIVPDPFFDWELGSAFLGTLSDNGELLTHEAGRSEIRAASGDVRGQGAVGVSPFSIDPSASMLNGSAGAPGQVIARPEGLYFTHPEGSRILFQSPDGAQEVLAGNGTRGYSPDGTPAREAKLNLPEGLALDEVGNLIFSERGNHLVRVVPRSDTTFAGQELKAGCVYTVAGAGAPGFAGDGGPATLARLNSPGAIELGPGGRRFESGGWLISDAQNGRIREVAGDGTISTLMGGGGQPLTPDGVSAKAYGGSVGYFLARDAIGNLALSAGSQLLFHCRQSGWYFGRAMLAGTVYGVAGQTQAVFDGDGRGTSVRLWDPRGLVFDSRGNLFFGDAGTGAIRVLRPDGNLRWLAGLLLPPGYSKAPTITEVAPATSVKLVPRCLALRPDGSLVVGDFSRLEFRELAPRLPGALYSQ